MYIVGIHKKAEGEEEKGESANLPGAEGLGRMTPSN